MESFAVLEGAGDLTPVWHEKPPPARTVRWRIGAMLDWAVAMEFRTETTRATGPTRCWVPTITS